MSIVVFILQSLVFCFHFQAKNTNTSMASKSETIIICSPLVTNDPRFKAGRSLVKNGHAGGAIEIFSSLVEETVHKYGESSIEAAPAYYEYGNSLLRALGSRTEEERTPQEAAAAAAIERSDTKPAATKTHQDVAKEEKDSEESASDDDDDAHLGLEMMENAFSILDAYRNGDEEKYRAWMIQEIPRVLMGIGDCLSAIERHPDAADAYSRAYGEYQEILGSFSPETVTLEHFKAHRKVCEATILIAEELLACPEGKDVITSETESLIVVDSERIEYARGYYDQARESLQETLFFMANLP